MGRCRTDQDRRGCLTRTRGVQPFPWGGGGLESLSHRTSANPQVTQQLHKHLRSGGGRFELFKHSPRMVPRAFNPKMLEVDLSPHDSQVPLAEVRITPFCLPGEQQQGRDWWNIVGESARQWRYLSIGPGKAAHLPVGALIFEFRLSGRGLDGPRGSSAAAGKSSSSFCVGRGRTGQLIGQRTGSGKEFIVARRAACSE